MLGNLILTRIYGNIAYSQAHYWEQMYRMTFDQIARDEKKNHMYYYIL